MAGASGSESTSCLRRLSLWALSCLLILAFACGTVVFAFFHRFYPSVALSTFPPAHDLATAQWQDFEYFRRYLKVDQAYSPDARLHAIRLLNEYQTQAGSLSPAQFDLAVSRMVALADNGHSAVYKGSLSRRNNRLPCRFYHFSDGYYVIRAQPACRSILGAKVTARWTVSRLIQWSIACSNTPAVRGIITISLFPYFFWNRPHCFTPPDSHPCLIV